MKIHLFLLICLFSLSFTTSSAIYKWVDEKGVTHFGTHLPTNENKQLTIEEMNLLTGESELTNNMAENIASANTSNEPLIDDDNGQRLHLNCAASIKNIAASVDNSLFLLNKNFEEGHIQQADYSKSSGLFSNIKNRTSLDKCTKSIGAERKFYTCMTADVDNLVSCLKKARA